MKKIIIVLAIVLFLSIPAYAVNMENLKLQKQMLEERIGRLKAERNVMALQFNDNKQAVEAAQQELKNVNARIKAEEKKQSAEAKKPKAEVPAKTE